MKIPMMKLNFVLSAVCLAGVSGGCGNMKSESYTEKPEDRVVKLKTLEESPKSQERDYKVGETVAIIRNNGAFELDGEITEIGKNIVLAEDAWSRKILWKPSNFSRSQPDDEKFAAKGYHVSTPKGRSYVYEWFPARQIFPVPWANNVNLKVGDAVYIKSFTYEPARAVVEKVPESESGSFLVRRDGHEATEYAEENNVFSTVEPARLEALSPGDIVFYDKSGWAMVVGKKGDKIIIRLEGFSPQDMIVDVSKLQIFK